MLRLRIILFTFILLSSLSLSAWQESNPFELSPRLEKTDTAQTITPTSTGNPFDVLPSVESPQSSAPQAVRKESVKTSEQEQDQYTAPASSRLALIVNILLFLLLTILTTFFRSQLGRAYRAFLNDNMLGQLQRERETVGGLPYYLFYILFFCSAGFFLYQISQELGYVFYPGKEWLSLFTCIGFIVAFFLTKHLILIFIANTFPVEKEVKLYSMTIIVFSLILGLLLLPVNLLLSFAPESASSGMLILSLLIIASLYLFRTLRAIFIANKYLLFHKFHFLLYICTVEIVPVVIIVRLILG